MVSKIVLIGGFQQIIELCEDENIEIVGVIDNSILTDTYLGYPIIGTDKDAPMLYPYLKDIPILITPDKPQLKKKLAEYYASIGYKFASLISSKAMISKSAIVSSFGVLIYHGVRISSNVHINDFVRINAGASLDHDVKIGRYSNVAPYSVILGRAIINEQVYVGANSTILPKIKIFDNSIIGAGAVVTKDIPENEVWAGNPARFMKLFSK